MSILDACVANAWYTVDVMRDVFVIANWKMNPSTIRDARRIFAGTLRGAAAARGAQVIVCPPSLFLPELATELKKSKVVALGAQDLSSEEAGAYTGQISASMLLPYKVAWTLLGHSERRMLGETDEHVALKVRHAITKGISPILCIGERERNDDGAFYTLIRTQLEVVFALLKRKDIAKLTIAYEPVWAIGKSASEAMSTAQLYEMALYIRKILIERYGRTIASEIRILYGGAVKAENARSLIQESGVDGLLVGSASLDPKQFAAILRAVSIRTAS